MYKFDRKREVVQKSYTRTDPKSDHNKIFLLVQSSSACTTQFFQFTNSNRSDKVQFMHTLNIPFSFVINDVFFVDYLEFNFRIQFTKNV